MSGSRTNTKARNGYDRELPSQIIEENVAESRRVGSQGGKPGAGAG